MKTILVLMVLATSACGQLGGKLTDAAKAAAQCMPAFASCVVEKYRAAQGDRCNVAP